MFFQPTVLKFKKLWWYASKNDLMDMVIWNENWEVFCYFFYMCWRIWCAICDKKISQQVIIPLAEKCCLILRGY